MVLGGSGGYRRLPGGSAHFSLQTNTHFIIIYISPLISLDLLQLYEGLREKLPAYARPIFVRLVNKIDVTGKHSRPDLLIMHETRGSNDMTNMIL